MPGPCSESVPPEGVRGYRGGTGVPPWEHMAGWGSIPVVFFPGMAGHPCPPYVQRPFPSPRRTGRYGKGMISSHGARRLWVWDWIHWHTSPRTRFPFSRHPPFTHYPSPPRSLVCGGQTSPHKPRLVVSHSTCPPLSSSPHAHSFVFGTAVIHNNPVQWVSHPLVGKPPRIVGGSPTVRDEPIYLCEYYYFFSNKIFFDIYSF
jgi:hypothetical protein